MKTYPSSRRTFTKDEVIALEELYNKIKKLNLTL